MSDTKPTRVVSIHRGEGYHVYIGRMGHGSDGFFGNPFRSWDVRYDGLTDDQKLYAILEDFRLHFAARLARDPEYRRRVDALKGKVLGCFCAPAGGLTADDVPWRCHGQIIAAYLDAGAVPAELRRPKPQGSLFDGVGTHG